LCNLNLLVNIVEQALKPLANILVITQRVPYPPNKGEKLRTYHQLEYLSKLGHTLTVMTPIDDVLELENANLLSQKLNIEVITQAMVHKAIRFASGIINGRSLSEANFFSSALMEKVKTHALKADVILCSASSLAKYVFNLPTVDSKLDASPILLMDLMDVDSDKWLQYANSASWPMRLIYKREHKLIKQLEKKIMSRFDYGFIIAQAEYDLFQTTVCQSDNLFILGNGIDQIEFTPNHISTEFTQFLFAGVMDYKPNVDAVLWFINNCWASIKKQVPNARLTLAGMNPSAKINALSKDSSIEITGFVDNIIPYFHRADVFIAPFQIARGVQNKVLQAMSCAIPVVTTSLGAEGILTSHNINMIVADKAKEFTNACLLLVNDKQLRKKIGNEAHKTITDNYSWKNVLNPLEQAVTGNRIEDENNG
jgi:sugar transferase (PEP-CTERM/EpsH1 system associated)